MSKLSRRLVALTFSTVVCVLLLEAFFWLVPRSIMPREFRLLDRVYNARGAWQDMMTGDPYLGYKLKPDLDIMFPSEGRFINYKTTSYGMGDIGFRDVGTEPPFDAIVVGDSFALCDDVPAETCWIRYLDESTGLSFGSLGVNGYSTLAEARVLERYGVQFNPRLVLVGVHPNDFKDNVNFDDWTRSGTDDLWAWVGQRHGRGQLGRTLSNYSMLFRMVDGFWRSRSRTIYRYDQDGFNFVFRFDRWWTEVLKDTEGHPGFKLMQDALLEMQQRSAAMGAEFMVLLWPTKEQIYWEQAKTFVTRDDVDPDKPVDAVYRFCERSGIPCCVMTEELRAEARRGVQLYHPINQHWNDAGNLSGAREVERCLTEAGILARLAAPASAPPSAVENR